MSLPHCPVGAENDVRSLMGAEPLLISRAELPSEEDLILYPIV
jgi:hypothetical protein